MSRTRILSVVLAGLMGLVAVVAAPTAASAAVMEWDTAVAGTPPAGLPNSDCVEITGATMCFVANGDRWWVRDTAADSASAAVEWENVASVTKARAGYCVNSLGNGRWGYCSKNYVEGSLLFAVPGVYDASEDKWIRKSAIPKTYYPVDHRGWPDRRALR